MANESNDPNWSIQLPGLPQLKTKDLPSFLLPSNVKGSLRVALPPFKELINTLDSEINPKILVNTFDELEPNALKAIENYKFYGIGPLIPSAFLDGNDPLDSCFGADLFDKSNDYIEWLYTKENSSVVYISFGSLMNPSISQMEEISKGLIDIGRPFLWIIKEDEKNKESEKKVIGCIEELEKIGKIVPWCSQLEVLRHPSLGCFVSHCGWNSALESLACGVPVVAFPQWTDQMTNAKQIEDVWKSGVRVNVNEDGIVESEELKRCIECVMDGGVKGEEMRKNAKKWKELAREAVKEGGSSHKNLKAFIDEVAKAKFVRDIIPSVLENIGGLVKIHDPYSPLYVPETVVEHIEDVSKELKLLLNFVWFVAERFIEPQSQHHVNFFTHLLAVSGHISTLIWLYLPDLAPEQMNVMLSDFLRMKIKPIQSCIRKIYADVLLSLKSTIQSGWCTNIGNEDAIDSEGRLLETILHNLVEVPTNSNSSQRVSLKDHLETLQKMLNFLRANIFHVPIKDLEFLLREIEIVVIDVGLLVYSFYEDEEEKEDMAPGGVNITQVLDLSSNITSKHSHLPHHSEGVPI
ncbi:hypothetical protein KY290_009726 [Solanum tuberosum]|uniref:Glycosyltransferase n=1 Tax=Solanum tuberosum TaxID=4113 RepID=A0ABQ7VXU0_SOLTU|nr:hypothetical protein KY290_009726 [Solanum tuberosum]